MKLHIANSTRQHARISLRIPEYRMLRSLEIPSGSQVQIGDGLNENQINSIIEHLDRFGARPVSALSSHPEDFAGLTYRLEKPVTESQIVNANEMVIESAQKRAVNESIRSVESFDVSLRGNNGKGKRTAKETTVNIERETVDQNNRVRKENLMNVTVGEGGDNDKSVRAR